MDGNYRVLGIAPFEGMKSLMSALAEEYPQMDLTLLLGDLEQGLEIARSNFHGDYDVGHLPGRHRQNAQAKPAFAGRRDPRIHL